MLCGSLLLACAACGGTGESAATHHPTGSRSHSAPTRPPASAPTSTPASSAPSTPSSLPTGFPRCSSAQLAISLGQRGAGLGHEGAAILFENTGRTECSLSGYPGVVVLGPHGTQVGQAQRTPRGYLGGMETGSATPPVVDLPPGALASAFVEGTDVPEGTAVSCPTYPALLVTPPTATSSVRLTVSLPGCSAIQVHPIVSGTNGSTAPA